MKTVNGNKAITAPLSQGALANSNGKKWEKRLSSDLMNYYGFQEVSYSDLQKAFRSGTFPFPRIFASGAPFRSIYGGESSSEFIVASVRNNAYRGFRAGTKERPFLMRIECKSQTSRGSVDEKFCYVVNNAEQTLPARLWEQNPDWLEVYKEGSGLHQIDWESTYGYPENHVLLVVDVPGARKSAQQWMLDAVAYRDQWDRLRLPQKVVGIETLDSVSAFLSGLFRSTH